MKEIFIEEHDRLIAQYLEAHPNATEDQAYDATGDAAYCAMQDKFADMVDREFQAEKDGRLS